MNTVAVQRVIAGIVQAHAVILWPQTVTWGLAMKHFFKLAALSLALGAFAAPIAAKEHGDKHDRDRRGNGDHRDHRDRDTQRGDHIANGRVIFQEPRNDRYDDRDRRYHPRSGHWDNGRRGPPAWAKGRDYRVYRYERIVYVPYNDYRRYDLYAPRNGYRWMRDDAGHYLLVSIASGIISDILYRHGL